MKQKEIKVLMVAPGEYPQVVVLRNDLDALQKAVSIVAVRQRLMRSYRFCCGFPTVVWYVDCTINPNLPFSRQASPKPQGFRYLFAFLNFLGDTHFLKVF